MVWALVQVWGGLTLGTGVGLASWVVFTLLAELTLGIRTVVDRNPKSTGDPSQVPKRLFQFPVGDLPVVMVLAAAGLGVTRLVGSPTTFS